MSPYFVSRRACPACGAQDSNTLRDIGYTEPPIKDYLTTFYSSTGPGIEFEYLQGGRYILQECGDCGLVFQRDVPNDFLMGKLYEQWLDPQIVREMVNRERTAAYYLWCASEIAGVLQQLGKSPADTKFLDFGMGWGNWCNIAKGFGSDVYGAELSDSRNAAATVSGIKVLTFDQLAGQEFDFINAEQVFEHLPQPLETLTRLRSALKPNGIIRINVPNGTDIKKKLAGWDWSVPKRGDPPLNDVAPLQHINCYNYESLTRMAAKVGLHEREIPNVFYRPQGVKAQIKAILRPYFHSMFPRWRQARRRLSCTTLCFRATA